MARPNRRRLLVALVLLAGAVLAYLAFRPAPVAVEAALADLGPLRVTVDWIGKTRVRDRYQVAAPVAGELARPERRPGDRVRRGEVLGRIAGAAASPLDPRTRAELLARREAARAGLAEAESALERAQAAAALARGDAARAVALGRADGLSPQALEAARAGATMREEEVHMTTGALRRTQAELAGVEAALGGGRGGGGPVEVLAPADGLVLRVARESGGPVAQGAPLFELGEPGRLEVVLDLPTSDAVRLRPGQAALATGWGGAGALAAVVRRIEPSAYTKVSPLGVEEQRVDVLLDPSGPGWEALGDGYALDVQVVVESLAEAVRVPSSALFRAGDGWALYAVEQGRARRRAVEVSARGEGRAALAAGLRPGERVVLHPGDELAEGVRLRVR